MAPSLRRAGRADQELPRRGRWPGCPPPSATRPCRVGGAASRWTDRHCRLRRSRIRFPIPLLCSCRRDSGGSGDRVRPLHARSVLAREARQEPVSGAPSLASNRDVDGRGAGGPGLPSWERGDDHSRITGCRYVELVMDRCTHCRTSYGSSGAIPGDHRFAEKGRRHVRNPMVHLMKRS